MVAALTTEAPAPAGPPDPPDHHTPFLARLRRAGANPSPFRRRGLVALAMWGIAALALLAAVPYLYPRAAPFTERLAALGAMLFVIAAPGLWMGLGRRSFLVAGVLTLAIYGITGWTGAALHQGDLYVPAVFLGLAIFGLAGFNLVFVLEEVVYDAHRHLPARVKSKAWVAVPSLACAGLAAGIPYLVKQPWWVATVGSPLTALWLASLLCTALMAAWWLFALANHVESGPAIVRELHLFVTGILLAALTADSIPPLVAAESLIPGLVAYAALLATWVYVSYTTLQRTHFLLRGRNAAPWVSILLAASYAIVAQAQALKADSNETQAVQELFRLRMEFMVAGMGVGIAFYVGRSMWRGLRLLQRSGILTPRGKRVAGGAARVAEGLILTERKVGRATLGLYRALDEVLPGHVVTTPPTPPLPPAPPAPPKGWELDEGSHAVVRVADDEERGE